MATGLELINKGVCGEGSLVGYNMSKGCPVPFQEIKELWVTPASFEFDMTQVFNEDYIKSIQLSGNLSIIKNIVGVTDNGTDTQVSASGDGTESIAGDKKYKFNFKWRGDDWLQKQLSKLVGGFNKRICFVDNAGNIAFCSGTSSTKKRGYLPSTIYLDRKMYTGSGSVQEQGLNIQFYDASEFDSKTEVIASEMLDFDPRLVESIVQAYVEFNAVPANLGTTIEVKVLVDRGRNLEVTGLTTSGDFKVLINGVQEADSAANETSPGVYEITTTALATDDLVEVSINGVKEVVGDALYVSNTDKITVV